MKQKKGFVLREVCGENVIVAEGIETVNFNKLISLNGCGTKPQNWVNSQKNNWRMPFVQNMM